MFTSVDMFVQRFKEDRDATLKILSHLTDESLTLPEHDIIRTCGRLAWHIVTTYPEMCGRFGIIIDGPNEKSPIPATVKEITDAYIKVTDAVIDAITKWQPDDFEKEDDMYGTMWKRGFSLWVVLTHEIHHRGQLTVFMRLAGLKVPGLYGPAMEEWSNYGVDAPAV